jgi:hypothetical protein
MMADASALDAGVEVVAELGAEVMARLPRTAARPGRPSPPSREAPTPGGMVAITSDAKIILWTVKGASPSVSRDGGKTWTPVKGMRESTKLPDWSAIDLQPQADPRERINDDKHQFGTANSVEGDPRVFGRMYLGTSGRGIVVGEPK